MSQHADLILILICLKAMMLIDFRTYYFINLTLCKIISLMSELMPIKSRDIARSMGKLQKAASQGRFRIKSFRVKTSEQQKVNLDRDYETELIHQGFSKQFLKKLYVVKSEQSQLKTSQAKYSAFVRSLHQKIIRTNTLNLSSCNFPKKAAELFMKEFRKVNLNMICLDLSNCTFLTSQGNVLPESSLMKFIFNNKRIVEVKLRNMCLKQEDISLIFNKIIQTSSIFHLNIGNENSQSMNRISDNLDILYEFFKRNQTVAILDLENLSIKKYGVQQIYKGISANVLSPLRILSLKNNAITEQASLNITLLAKMGIVKLDLSQNPLGPNFYLNLQSWRASTITKLDVSDTNMNSEALIFFFSRLEENKAIQSLKMDRNDFSNNWFCQMKEALEVNTSVQSLSMVDCRIKRMNQAFQGLYHNRYLKKLNISNNQFEEGAKQLSVLLTLNRTLKDIRLRFCGMKADQIASIFIALTENTDLNSLDISENQMLDNGAKEALKCLNQNKTLCYLSFDKVQIPIRVKRQIEDKIKANKIAMKNGEFNRLKKQNKNVKDSDMYTWEDVARMENKVRTNANNIRILQSFNSLSEKKFQIKKNKCQKIIEQYTDRQTSLKIQIDLLEKKMKAIEEEQSKVIKDFRVKANNAVQQARIQQSNIAELEEQIQRESIRNQKRENELEDQFQNNKYLKKKQQFNKKESVPKGGFDTSTAMNSKRKSQKF